MSSRLRDRSRYAGRKVSEAYEESWLIKIISWLLLSGLLVALVRVAIINIQPYFNLVHGDDEASWITYIPFVGWFAQRFGEIVAGVGAILIWSVVQIFQVMWLLVALDRKAQRNAIREARRNSDDGDLDDPNPRTRKIARKSRGIPFFFIRWSGIISLAAYVFDAVIGVHAYPIAESLGSMFFALGSGFTDSIDMENVRNLLSMLFAFEMVAIPTAVVVQWVSTRSRED